MKTTSKVTLVACFFVMTACDGVGNTASPQVTADNDALSAVDATIGGGPQTCKSNTDCAGYCAGDNCIAGVCKHIHEKGRPAGTSCNDGNACTDNDVCDDAGACVGKVNDCEDGNACTVDACDLVKGCVHTPLDATPCELGDNCQAVCAAGQCQGVPGACACNADADCAAVETTANDCYARKCLGGRCVVAFDVQKAGIDDGNVCTDDVCVKGKAVHTYNTAPCDDKNVCTTTSSCNGAGLCLGTANLNCDDKEPCTVDACDPSKGCTHSANPCDDGDPYTSNSCVNGLGCQHAALWFVESVDKSKVDGQYLTPDFPYSFAPAALFVGPAGDPVKKADLDDGDADPSTLKLSAKDVCETFKVGGAVLQNIAAFLGDSTTATWIGGLATVFKDPVGNVVPTTLQKASYFGLTPDVAATKSTWCDTAK